MFRTNFIHRCIRGVCCMLSLAMLATPFPSYADKEDTIAANQAITVESNLIEDWPTGPTISAASAILIEAETGVILYEKNAHSLEYPASTTKILTTLIAIENCSMDELVTFSYDAVHDIDPGSNHIAIDVGEQLTMEDCLKAILIRSANEVSFAVAEHIAGDSWENFAAIMNERAKELGCLNSNFVNPNGLPNEEHVTTAYDMAMIGRAFFDNDILCKMTLTRQLRILPSENQPDDISENNQMELIPGGEYEYEYLVGCKTGYTNAARSCLVSCAEKDGMKLICVVLRDEAPYQYEDTIALFNYGFSNFEKKNVSQNETKYNIGNDTFLYSDYDIFGNSEPILSLNKEDFIVIPKTAQFEEIDSEISYDTDAENEAAVITYTYHDVYVGSASIDFAAKLQKDYDFEISNGADSAASAGESAESEADQETSAENAAEDTAQEETSFVFINMKKILLITAIAAGVLVLGCIVWLLLRNFQFYDPRRNRRLGRRTRRRRNHYNEVSYDLRKKRKQQIAEAKRRQRRARVRK